MGRLRVSLYGTRDAAANWEDAYAEVLREHLFDRGVACPCSFQSRVRGVRIIVHGDDFISGGPRHQLKWLEEVMDKHCESKHTVMESSSDLAKSLTMLNDKRHCVRVVEAVNLQHSKTVVTPAVRESESADGESTRDCSRESMQNS